jgi:hypothetical protein
MSASQETASKPFDPDDLPGFVDTESMNFFALRRSGDALRDLTTGASVADQALAYARRHQSDEILLLCLVSIILGGCFEDLEAGFIRRLAAAAYAGHLN